MRYIYLVIAVVIMVLVKLYLDYLKSNFDYGVEDPNRISYSKNEIRLGLMFNSVILGTIIAINIILENKYDASMISLLIFGPFQLGAVLITTYIINWEVTISDDSVIFRNWIRRSKKFKLDELEIQYTGSNYKIFLEETKLFRISDTCNNSMKLANELMKRNAKVRA